MDTPQSTNIGRDMKAQQAVEDVRSTAHEGIEQATQAAAPVMDRLSSTAHSAADRLSDFASQARSTLSDKASQLKDVQSQVVADTRQRIRDKPMAAMAIAVAAGFLVRQLFRRRH
ncbi:hypothetical protein [Lacisediminimonas sp.]|uniref:hypothetical protein n=1 Tax=Lacisediminimonas sp. TaxID=3060582 RepID=UPI00272870EE|nr:hypothetical protein [Lacisediminimonas sp.]MDO8299584.1 hypothetical protein [Lacisediminimonas sp.]